MTPPSCSAASLVGLLIVACGLLPSAAVSHKKVPFLQSFENRLRQLAGGANSVATMNASKLRTTAIQDGTVCDCQCGEYVAWRQEIFLGDVVKHKEQQCKYEVCPEVSIPGLAVIAECKHLQDVAPLVEGTSCDCACGEKEDVVVRVDSSQELTQKEAAQETRSEEVEEETNEEEDEEDEENEEDEEDEDEEYEDDNKGSKSSSSEQEPKVEAGQDTIVDDDDDDDDADDHLSVAEEEKAGEDKGAEETNEDRDTKEETSEEADEDKGTKEETNEESGTKEEADEDKGAKEETFEAPPRKGKGRKRKRLSNGEEPYRAPKKKRTQVVRSKREGGDKAPRKKKQKKRKSLVIQGHNDNAWLQDMPDIPFGDMDDL